MLGFYYARDNMLSRDELANILWKQEVENYTNWALDKAISRLRSKLNKLGIVRRVLITFRDKGYQLLLRKYD